MCSQMYSYWPGTSSMCYSPSSERDVSSTSKFTSIGDICACSLPHSEVPATCLYCEPDTSSPRLPIPPLADPFCCYPPNYAKIIQVVSFPQVSQPKDSAQKIQSCRVYISTYTVMNTTILQLVAIYNVQLHVSALYVGHHPVVQRTY